ncbi:MAG: hypothetical protein JWQ14_2765 [Adhaeribacter sp.]|nr:hypothetical protein [Adhaeribacter sp.]
MKSRETFTHLEFLNREFNTLTVESDLHIIGLKSICNAILKEIDIIKIDSVSDHITLTKVQAKQYINKGLQEIEKYNNPTILRSLGNFTDVLKPIHAGLELVLNLDY